MNKLTAAKLAGSNSDNGRVAHDYYATPFIATQKILDVLPLGEDSILEPAAGEGHIVKVLRDYYPNNPIIASDLIWRKSRFNIPVVGDIDFLTYNPPCKFDTIITNPPFKHAQEFVEKALAIANHYVLIFAKLQFLETVERQKLFTEHPPKCVYVFSRRVSPLVNGEELNANGKAWNSPMAFAWYLWEIGYKGETMIKWI